MLSIQLVTDPDELLALHQAAGDVADPTIQCSPESMQQPLPESLIYYGDEAPHADVVVGYSPDGTPAAYVVIDAKTGRVSWLVLIGVDNATPSTVAEVCEWCRLNYGTCFGVVENEDVRALFAQPGATVTGNQVTWTG